MRIALIETAFVAMVFNKGFEQGTYEVEVLLVHHLLQRGFIANDQCGTLQFEQFLPLEPRK